MRRITLVLMIITICTVLAGCSLPFGKDEPKEEPKKEKNAEEQITAPYIGYAPLDEKTNKILSAVNQSFPEGSSLEVLKYEAGENNKAIVRIEKYKKDKWETVQEQSLFLTHNVRNGYMVFNGNRENGITVNTDTIKQGEKEAKNVIHFKEEKYAESQMFHKPKDSEGRMDLTEKQVLMIGFEKGEIYSLNGNVVPKEQGKIADIKDIYENKDGLIGKSGQKLTAVTIEFVYDELIPKMPYINKGEKEITYAAGLATEAEVKLQMLVEDMDTREMKWQTVGEPVVFPLEQTGTLDINGSAKDGKITVKIGDEKGTFKYETEDDSKISYEADGLSEPNVSAKSGLVLNIAEAKDPSYEATEGKRDLQTLMKETGASADEIYKEYVGELAEANALYYALVMEVR